MNQNQSEIKNSTTIISHHEDKFGKIISYFALVIILLGLTGNTAAFILFRFNKDLKRMPSLVILSFVCITDLLALFTWNLDHFLTPNYGTAIETLNIYTCRIFTFIQYASLQSSAILLSFTCVDRYFTVIARPGRHKYVGTVKSSTIWSILIVTCCLVLNSYLLFMDRKSGTKNFHCYVLANGFKVSEIWDKVHLVIYSLIPSILMLVFNVLLIKNTPNRLTYVKYKIPAVKAISSNTNSQSSIGSKKRNLTFSLLFISFMFLACSLPGMFLYGVFPDEAQNQNSNIILTNIMVLFDFLAFLYHATIFFNCLLTNLKFRKIVLDKLNHLRGQLFCSLELSKCFISLSNCNFFNKKN